jgi:predicted ferric reductase
MTDGPFLWYLNRGTGLVLLVALTLTTVLGILATRGRAGRGLPRFVTQALHRNLALLSVVFLVAHIVTAVADTYVDIRWWQAIVPWGGSYEPLWLGLGALALDLVVAVALTSWLRARMRHGTWRTVHLLAYLAWAMSVVHAVGIGTDLRLHGDHGPAWAVVPTVACVAAVALAVAVRLVDVVRRAGDDRPAAVPTGGWSR